MIDDEAAVQRLSRNPRTLQRLIEVEDHLDEATLMEVQ